MVTRKRFRTVLNALALYTIAALVIGYFGVNAYSGNRGLRAKQDLDQQIAELSGELDALKAERANWGRPVSLLKSESIAPDMLAARARACRHPLRPGGDWGYWESSGLADKEPHPEEQNGRCQQSTRGSARRRAPGVRRTCGGDA